jgi:hypothetical protein
MQNAFARTIAEKVWLHKAKKGAHAGELLLKKHGLWGFRQPAKTAPK